jgi:hypothetical protein
MREEDMNSKPSQILKQSAAVATFVLALASTLSAQQAASTQKGFDTAQQAADALLKAAEAGSVAELQELFGPEGKDIVSSGDPVQDKNHLAAYVALAKQKQTVETDPKNAARATLVVGAADWPLPVPVVKRKGKWYFDAATGRKEIVDRRVGANELDAIQVCRGFVEAQREYASLARDSTGINQYAQKLISSPGKQDGLYWQNSDGSAGGPISEVVARAIQEGYSPGFGGGYHGYYFKVLKGQGPAAPLGELDYVIKGIMIGGFALIAAPAEYRVSGVKTFIVSNDGIVYEKDLGPDTLNIAKGIERYNPDKTWRRTDDEWPPDAVR